jgi:hypothetical protein
MKCFVGRPAFQKPIKYSKVAINGYRMLTAHRPGFVLRVVLKLILNSIPGLESSVNLN